MVYQLLRVVLVIALVIWAAVLVTPKGRLPLALRGVLKILRRDRNLPPQNEIKPPSAAKRFCAFLLVLLALLIAIV